MQARQIGHGSSENDRPKSSVYGSADAGGVSAASIFLPHFPRQRKCVPSLQDSVSLNKTVALLCTTVTLFIAEREKGTGVGKH